MDQETKSTIQSRVATGLHDAVHWVIESRGEYYAKNPKEAPTPESVPSLISKYSYMNAAIAGGMNLIPGPLGMVAVAPEIVLIMRNQFAMIYDIGIAQGKKHVLSPSLLLGIFALGTGSGGLGLVVMQGQKVLVKRAGLRVLQKIIAKLAGNITQKMLKQFLAKWLPGIGAVAMSLWAGLTTKKLGHHAADLLSREVEESQEDDEHDAHAHGAQDVGGEVGHDHADVLKRHVLCLINLMNVDGRRHPAELEFIDAVIAKGHLDAKTAESLRARSDSAVRYPVGFKPFRDDADAGSALMVDLLALARRDDEFHDREKAYILEVGAELGYSKSELIGMIDFNPSDGPGGVAAVNPAT